jgi:hypothetical protein
MSWRKRLRPPVSLTMPSGAAGRTAWACNENPHASTKAQPIAERHFSIVTED